LIDRGGRIARARETTVGCAGEERAAVLEPRRARLARRAITLPLYGLATLLVVASLPLTAPLALAIDLLRRRGWLAIRALLFACAYLGAGSLGLLASFANWVPWALGLSTKERYFAQNYAVQFWWAGRLFAAAERCFGLRVRIEGLASLAAAEVPLLVFARHASLPDALLPILALSLQHGVRLRYVIKRELLYDPCLDVVGQRIPNAFVLRDSEDPSREIARVRVLANALRAGEGVVIFPEGTRFTPEKRERAIARLERSDPALAERAKRLERVLPPRLGGPLGLLEAAPTADVVFLAHAGLERALRWRDLARGALVGLEVLVELRHVPRAAIPIRREQRARWLFDEWERVDVFAGKGE
jgi:1-acyl-sn-glycerol-3-phosphate acyltransferase